MGDDDQEILAKTLDNALSGRGAHVGTLGAIDGLDWTLVGETPSGAPHSIFQLLNHMIYWQDFGLRRLDGEEAPSPEHAAESWPGGVSPRSAEEWQRAVDRFERGLAELNRHAQKADVLFSSLGKWTPLELLHLTASHNSYHLGQIVSLRRVLGAWPPPGGGETW